MPGDDLLEGSLATPEKVASVICKETCFLRHRDHTPEASLCPGPTSPAGTNPRPMML